MPSKTQLYHLTEGLYPAYFVEAPGEGYSEAHLEMLRDKSLREVELARRLLETVLEHEAFDLRVALPGTPRTSEELREFVRRAAEQVGTYAARLAPE